MQFNWIRSKFGFFLLKFALDIFEILNIRTYSCFQWYFPVFDLFIYFLFFIYLFISLCLGELYTWGCGSYGRLGHGTSEDMFVPTLVSNLLLQVIVGVSCGTCDAHTLAVSEDGTVSIEVMNLWKYLHIFWFHFFAAILCTEKIQILLYIIVHFPAFSDHQKIRKFYCYLH